MKLALAAWLVLTAASCGRPSAPIEQRAQPPAAQATSTSKASTPPLKTEPVVIEYIHRRGVEVARGLNEAQSNLLVDTSTGRATLLMVRDEADNPGQPIGHFATVLEPAALTKLVDAGREVDWDALPVANAGGPGHAFMRLRFREGTVQHDVGFSSMDITLMDKLPLLTVLHETIMPLYASPQRALQVELPSPVDLAVVQAKGFTLKLTNVGKEPLCILDPRRLIGDHDAFAGVNVGALTPETPGMTPPPVEWQRVGQPVLDADAMKVARTRHIVLQAGQSHEVHTVPWSPQGYTSRYPRSGEWILQAQWLDYDMPEEIDGVPCVRGATFSTPVRLRA
jgi:hypothetical protein